MARGRSGLSSGGACPTRKGRAGGGARRAGTVPGEGLGRSRCALLCGRPQSPGVQPAAWAGRGLASVPPKAGAVCALPSQTSSVSREGLASQCRPRAGGAETLGHVRSRATLRWQDLLPGHSSWGLCGLFCWCHPGLWLCHLGNPKDAGPSRAWLPPHRGCHSRGCRQHVGLGRGARGPGGRGTGNRAVPGAGWGSQRPQPPPWGR